MEDGKTLFQGLTLTPRAGIGFITDAKLLKFSSPFPQSPTRLIGGELSLDFGRRKNNETLRVGELALLYYWGKAQDQFDQNDLPLANNPLSDLIRFSNKREAMSHTLLGEWRWPSF